MAPTYVALAKTMLDQNAWQPAAIAFCKAHAVDPAGPQQKEARAGQHYALGRALQASGKSGKPEFEAALAIDPQHEGAQAALAGKPAPTASKVASDVDRPSWMLYAGLGGGAFAILLLFIAVRRR